MRANPPLFFNQPWIGGANAFLESSAFGDGHPPLFGFTICKRHWNSIWNEAQPPQHLELSAMWPIFTTAMRPRMKNFMPFQPQICFRWKCNYILVGTTSRGDVNFCQIVLYYTDGVQARSMHCGHHLSWYNHPWPSLTGGHDPKYRHLPPNPQNRGRPEQKLILSSI